MLLKFLLKIWPSFLPILVYIFWVYVIDGYLVPKLLKKKTDIEGEKVEEKLVGEKSTEVKTPGKFSLQNRCFVIILYMTLILAILTLIATAFSQ